MPLRTVVIDASFALVLKKLRERSGLSLRRLAKLSYCSHGYLWDLENGHKKPSVSVAALLDAALGAGGSLSAMVREVSADSGGHPQVESNMFRLTHPG